MIEVIDKRNNEVVSIHDNLDDAQYEMMQDMDNLFINEE